MKKSSKVGWIPVVVGLAIVVLSMFRGTLATESQAIGAVEAIGFTDVTVTEHAWFAVGLRGCGGDSARFTVRGKNPIGKATTVYVCVGWPMKGATVRTP